MKPLLAVLMLLLWATSTQAAVIETQEWESMPVPPWAKNTAGQVIDAAPNPSSPSGSSALKFTCPAGTYAASLDCGRLERAFTAAPTEVYIGHWYRWSNPFTFNPVGTKIDYFKTNGTCPTINTLCYVTVRLGTGPTSLAMDVGIQGNGAFVSEPHIIYNNKASVNFQLNTWYWLETHLIMNTVGQRNGTIEVWVNDTLVAQHTNVRFVDVATTWNYLQHSPVWGGSGGTIPATQYSWVDHTVLSTTRIGCPVPSFCGASADTQPPTMPTSLTVQ